MTKRNPYLQHTYESFDQPVPPRRQIQEEPGFAERVLNSEFAQRFRSPVFATAALLITGAAFAGIIIATYPSSKQPDGNIPVVTADATPLREAPSDPGGMNVAHEDSTVYGAIRSGELQETPPIENLLAEEKPVDTQTLASSADASAQPPSASALQPAETAVVAEADDETAPPSEMADATDSVEEAGKVPPATVAKTIPLKSDAVAAAETTQKPALAPAASTPETLAYVRSVLEKKDAQGKPTQTASAAPSVETLAAIEPTAGAASPGAVSAIKPGNNYIQLASISSESAAPKEWAKLQKSFPSLKEAQYRVQRADLGAKGVFYRIQAGPMSKDSAKSVCNSIKSQKPGGCLVVQ